MLDVADGGCQNTLIGRDEAPFHLFRTESGKIPDHRDDGDIDVGEDVGGCPQNHDRTHQQNEKSQHQEGIGASKGNSDNPHLGS